ncbi:MAG: UDP-N-acetylmuramoyl-tripeptide--D-alanyl-D-alanine ligase [Chloroflexi bacterium]|nr:UDP-N-acetylmuramoyl-tripeptide--D-alanyl-D-alanine ligase [Chloroflexota bacterium]
MLTLAHIVEALTGYQMAGGEQVITDVVIDSRLSIPGALFVALPGERSDGHNYLSDAFRKGAAAALIEREAAGDIYTIDLREPITPTTARDMRIPVCLRVENSLAALQKAAAHWRARLSPRVVGITGSVGKTTTKELVAAVLQTKYRTLKNEGNLNNEIGLPMTVLRLTEAHERAVLEMGFYVPGEIALLCEIARPHIGVVTNVLPVHVERAGSLEAVARGKAELVEALPPAPEGVAVLNHDDPLVMGMAARTRARVFTYGLDPAADLWANNIVGLGLEGIRFQLHYGRETLHLRVPHLGRHSVHTSLRAAAVGLIEGLTWQEIVEGLSSGVQLRLYAVSGPGGSILLDDTYNASPESVIAALNLLAELDGRKIAVLGDMLELGEHEAEAHAQVGRYAREIADALVTVGKLGGLIAAEALAAGMKRGDVTVLPDTASATEFLRGFVRHGDVVLIKGSRGLRMDRIVSALEAGP